MTETVDSKTLSETTSQILIKASILAYFLGSTGVGLSAAIVGPTLAVLASNTGASQAQIGILFSIRAVGGLVGSLGFGRLYDRFSGHRLAAVMLFLSGIATVWVPQAKSLTLLGAIFLFLGVADGAMLVGYNTFIIWIKPQNANRRVNTLHFFFGIGAFVAPLLVSASMAISGRISWAYGSVALLAGIVGLLLAVLPSPTIPTSNFVNNRTAGDNRRMLTLILVFLIFYVGAELSFSAWIFTYARQGGTGAEQISLTGAALVNSAFWGAMTVGRLVAALLSVRLRLEHMLLIALSGSLFSALFMLFFPLPIPAIVMGTIGLGLFMAAIFPTTFSLADRRLGMTGNLAGWLFSSGAIAGMIWPWLTGVGISVLGVNAMPWIVTMLLSTDIFLFLKLRIQPK